MEVLADSGVEVERETEHAMDDEFWTVCGSTAYRDGDIPEKESGRDDENPL